MTKPPKRPRGRPIKYDFGQLELGGEMFIQTRNVQSVRNAAYEYGKRHQIELTTEEDKIRMGVWVIRPESRD